MTKHSIKTAVNAWFRKRGRDRSKPVIPGYRHPCHVTKCNAEALHSVPLEYAAQLPRELRTKMLCGTHYNRIQKELLHKAKCLIQFGWIS